MLMMSDDVGSTFKNKRRNFRTKLMTSQDVRTEFRNFPTSQIRASDSRSGHNQMNEDSFCLGVTTCHFNGTSTARTAEVCDTCESKPFKWCLLPKAKVGQRGIISKRNQWQFQWGYRNKHHHIWATRATHYTPKHKPIKSPYPEGFLPRLLVLGGPSRYPWRQGWGHRQIHRRIFLRKTLDKHIHSRQYMAIQQSSLSNYPMK